MRIGVFGGSFDPVHTGHLMVANYCSQFCGLDEVWLMVSPCNPLKADRLKAPMQLRLEMCAMAAAHCPRVKASDFEFGLPVPSYSYRTLCELRRTYPEHDFILVIGADNWIVFDRWRDHDRILREFDVLVYPRPGYPLPSVELPERVRVVDDPDAPIALVSSSFVRRAVADGMNVNYFIPPEVGEFVTKQHLYGN